MLPAVLVRWVPLLTIPTAVLVVQRTLLFAADSQQQPIVIGDRLELFVDDYLIESIENLTFHLHRPQRRERVLVPEKPLCPIPIASNPAIVL